MSCSCDGRGTCGCCEGVDFLTPVEIDNRPGLSALAYRVGTHGRFKNSMLAGISAKKALSALTTRQDDDLSIALLDGWATVLDVLTFYQERIANEGYLRTATERRSVLELARAIGYELGPGVAASTWLAFTLDDTEQAPKKVIVDVGTRAQSLPGKDELPQPFETTEEIEARPAWNTLLPDSEQPQLLAAPLTLVELQGVGLQLAAGDALVAIHHHPIEGEQREAFRITRVEEELPPPPSTGPGRTVVELEPLDPNAPELDIGVIGIAISLPPDPTGPEPLDAETVEHYFLNNTWTAEELAERAEILGWSIDELAEHLDDVDYPEVDPAVEFFAFRKKTNLFGHSGPRWETIPFEWRDPSLTNPAAPYPLNWEGQGGEANTDSQGDLHDSSGRVIFLDGEQKEILAGGMIVLREAGTRITRAYRVESAEEGARTDYGVSGKATRVTVDTDLVLDQFEVRNTTVWAASEHLPLAHRRIEREIRGGGFNLDRLAIGLEAGKQVIVEGERADLPGVVAAEVRTLEEVRHLLQEGRTQLAFDRDLDYRYVRRTVKVTANVAPATHGETKTEVLGSGSAATPFQRFDLKGKPLTYTSAPVPSGGESTLELKVNGVTWHESPDLYRLGSSDRQYILRRSDDGTTTVLFGDGERGARLPTGAENVTASYRVGTGLEGQMERGRINLLASQPLGVRGVVNPVPASGAEDPERLSGARRNAPLTVLTLDRIVSLQDFEDFARAFSGIGKARADRVWNGERRVIFVTVTGADGLPIPDDAKVLSDLRESMDRYRDPFQPVEIGPHQPLLFRLDGSLVIDPDYEAEAVLATAADALADEFSVDARDLAQPVAKSDILLTLQGVEGVIAIDLDTLELSPGGGGLRHGRLNSRPARKAPFVVGAAPDEIRGAQLLTLAPGGVTLVENLS